MTVYFQESIRENETNDHYNPYCQAHIIVPEST